MKKIAIFFVFAILIFTSGCVNEKVQETNISSIENETENITTANATNLEENFTEIENKTENVTRNVRIIYMTIWHTRYDPDFISVNKGDLVKIYARSEYTNGIPHGFTLPEYNINITVEARIDQEPQLIEFIADKPGYYEFYCGTCPDYFPKIKGRLNVMG